MTVLFDEAIWERAFGVPGEDGDPERLAHLAKRLNDSYERFLDWAASLRSVSVPSQFQNLLELAARYADEPVEKYRQFVDEYAVQVDKLLVDFAAGRPLRIDAARLVLSYPEEVIDDYEAELNRLRSQLHLEL
jgi:hypothetical protein